MKLKKTVFILLIIAVIFFASYGYIEKTFFYPLKYEDFVENAADAYDIDEYLIFSVIKAESSFDEYARSHADAKGLMQITDETAEWAAEKMNLSGEFNIYNPETNIRIGAWYLSKLLSDNGGSLIPALASYNAGGTNVKSWQEKAGTGDISTDDIEFAETREYVKKTLKYYEKYKKLYD